MSAIAFVFPGQGSQSVGMGAALVARSPAAAAVFAAADAALGESLSRLAWEGPAETLNLTENAQPALLATSIAYLAALRERWAARAAAGGAPAPEPAFVAGHSMGQYSAFVASGALDLADGVRLVKERGRLMQASSSGREGRMAALIGLDEARLPELVAGASAFGVFGVANRNAPGQVVVSGERAAVEASLQLARTLGARRAIELPVSVAAHSPLMAEAAEQMTAVLANADARPIRTADDARIELVEHLTTGVDWIRAVETMAADGITTFIEIGPGRVLTGLISRIAPGATTLATDAQNAPDGLAVP